MLLDILVMLHPTKSHLSPLFSPAAVLTDVMTLDNPVNGSSPAIRTDYTGHKTKGNTCLPQRIKPLLQLQF